MQHKRAQDHQRTYRNMKTKAATARNIRLITLQTIRILHLTRAWHITLNVTHKARRLTAVSVY